MTLDEIIAREVDIYLDFCRKAAQHDELEHVWKTLAHVVFYQLQEHRSTKKIRVTSPISTK